MTNQVGYIIVMAMQRFMATIVNNFILGLCPYWTGFVYSHNPWHCATYSPHRCSNLWWHARWYVIWLIYTACTTHFPLHSLMFWKIYNQVWCLESKAGRWTPQYEFMMNTRASWNWSNQGSNNKYCGFWWLLLLLLLYCCCMHVIVFTVKQPVCACKLQSIYHKCMMILFHLLISSSLSSLSTNSVRWSLSRETNVNCSILSWATIACCTSPSLVLISADGILTDTNAFGKDIIGPL